MARRAPKTGETSGGPPAARSGDEHLRLPRRRLGDLGRDLRRLVAFVTFVAVLIAQDLRVLIRRLDRVTRELEQNPQGLLRSEPLPYEGDR